MSTRVIDGKADVRIVLHLDSDKRYDVRWNGEERFREVREVIVNAADGTAMEYGAVRVRATGRPQANAQARSLHWDELPLDVRDMAREALSAVLDTSPLNVVP